MKTLKQHIYENIFHKSEIYENIFHKSEIYENIFHKSEIYENIFHKSEINEKLLINKNFKTVLGIEKIKTLLSSGKIESLPNRLYNKDILGYTLVPSDKSANELFDDIINSFITNKTYDKTSNIDDYVKNDGKIIAIILNRPKYNEIYIYKKINKSNVYKINIEIVKLDNSKILIYLTKRSFDSIDLSHTEDWASKIYEITKEDFNNLADFIKEKDK